MLACQASCCYRLAICTSATPVDAKQLSRFPFGAWNIQQSPVSGTNGQHVLPGRCGHNYMLQTHMHSPAHSFTGSLIWGP
eukprot:11211768-Lingulodinium_polyedra.AAC.1